MRVREMTIERVKHSGAIIVSALVYQQGVKWLESATYYNYTVKEAKRSFRESCKQLNYEIERG
jgi:predicted DNA binding protein